MARRLIYPLYQIGNPQLRIFRPPFSLTLVRPGKEQPQDTVQFRIPMEMTKCDVRNYLEKIYNVPVGAVRTRIQYCTNKKRNHLNQKVKRPDYKVAYVQLVQQRLFNLRRLKKCCFHQIHSHAFTDAQSRASCWAVSPPGTATAAPTTVKLSRG
ncbi:39S ribosomal protein L23, mitochondrial isoform X2 [Oncorhynchus tshawytscha]|uniref:39S ribosomal protein L23, mitochondrial isoform X2 n=1 Tax=Oncorhynchus tshawytscha TaxID=74940 RepID=UPI001C3E612A|nr:39S ribosomal protein L23, mitochondrial isoform X2 [Oncorhynchus tshawytscha]